MIPSSHIARAHRVAFTWEPMQAVVWSWYRLMSEIGAFWHEPSSDKGYANG